MYLPEYEELPDGTGSHIISSPRTQRLQPGSPEYISEKLACLVHSHFDLAVLTDRCFAYMSAENMGHQLRAVAESEYRNAHLKQFLAACSSTFLINAVRTSG